MRTARAVLFDLDGTLADTAVDLAASACDALEAVGMPAPLPASLHAYASRGGRGMLRAGWTGEWDELIFQRAFGEFLEIYARRMFESTALFDGIPAMLESLTGNGISWGIMTNKGQRYTRPMIGHLGLLPGCTVCGDMVGAPKPQPDGLLKAAEMMSVGPAHCIYVGDDGKDIAAARAAGMSSIAALYGYSQRLADRGLAGANWQAGSVEQLRSLLLDLTGAPIPP